MEGQSWTVNGYLNGSYCSCTMRELDLTKNDHRAEKFHSIYVIKAFKITHRMSHLLKGKKRDIFLYFLWLCRFSYQIRFQAWFLNLFQNTFTIARKNGQNVNSSMYGVTDIQHTSCFYCDTNETVEMFVRCQKVRTSNMNNSPTQFDN